MTKQEIITLLIKDYEEAIEKCKGMRYEDMHDYLRGENLISGVCYAAQKNHNEYIGNSEWIERSLNKKIRFGLYWTDTPLFLFNKKSIIASLQTRLSILKTELEIPE